MSSSEKPPARTLGVVPLLLLGAVAGAVITFILLRTSMTVLPQIQASRSQLYYPLPNPSASRVAQTATPLVEPPTPLAERDPLTLPARADTPSPMRLAVEQSVRARYRQYFDSLLKRYTGLVLTSYPGDAEIDHLLAAQTADWTLFWAQEQLHEAHLLREEPFVVAVHPAFPADSVTLEELRDLALGQNRAYALVAPDAGQAARELLNLEQVAPGIVRVADWQTAQEYVATHENTWALLPWDVVNYRTRLLSIEGQRPVPTDLTRYPLLRRLWLSGDVPVPQGLREDLAEALQYAPQATVELVAVGDIVLDRTARQMMQTDGPNYPFAGEGVREILRGADIAFGNLENPISTRGQRQPKTYTFRADPSVVEGLSYAGLDILSLANNHIGDYGDLALLDTLELLDESGIRYVGAGRTITEAHEIRIVEKRGLRIAFLAYNQIIPKSFAATATSPGTAWMELDAMVAAIQEARDKADLVVVSCHWGTEYRSLADASQQKIAKTLADAGADLIIGHHPHVLQGLRYHRDTLTVYSLGNFVFYAMFTPQASDTAILRCLLDAAGVKTAELIPVAIKNAQPRVLSPQESAPILQRIRRVTREQNGYPD